MGVEARAMKFPVRTILCASDLSETGDGAVSLAYALAAPGAVVHLLHVNEPAFVTSPLDATAVFAAPTSEGQVKAAEERATRHLKALVPAGGNGVTTQVHVVYEPGPAAVIAREASRLGADLVVMGTHGRGGLAKALLGSVASDVVKRAKVPVALFRAAH
jgi:nucleotide-binding universal stress UspA family protein